MGYVQRPTSTSKKGTLDDDLLAEGVAAKMDAQEPPPEPDVVDRTNVPPAEMPRDTTQDYREPTSAQTPPAPVPEVQSSPYTPSPGADMGPAKQTDINLQNKADKGAASGSTQRTALMDALQNADNKLSKQDGGDLKPGEPDPGLIARTTASAVTGAQAGKDGVAGPGGAQIPQMPIGFDAAKWNDPNYNTPKYQGSRIIAGGGTTQDVVNALGAGWTVVDGQRIRDPQGRLIDVIYGFNQGMHQAQWNVEGGDDASHDAPKSAGQTGSAGQGGQNSLDALIANLLNSVSPGAGAQSAGAGGQGGSNFNSQIRQSILNRLTQVQGGVDINDPAIRSRLSAYQAASQAALNRGQSKFAERAYAEGLPAGSQDANLQGAIQNSASDEGRYAGDLMGQQLESNKSELEQLLQLGSGLLTADEDRQIRAQIAAIDAQLQRQSLGQNNQQFYDRLGADIGSNEALLNERIMSYLNA